jgi:CobQ-like glutamine amidotransferase family enzyme
MSTGPELRVCVLYGERLNIYADRGNLAVLERRCRWRDIGWRLRRVTVGDELVAGEDDLLYLGGGEDADQQRCAEDLVTTKGAVLHEAAGRRAVVLGVCGGYQLLGHGYETPEASMPGVGLLDVTTVATTSDRLVGHAAVEIDLGGERRVLAGFENHRGRTTVGPGASPLGRVLHGFGNNGEDGTEGAVRGSVVGTYLHGPLLAANAWFADWLIATALGLSELARLDDGFEQRAHDDAVRRAAGEPAPAPRPRRWRRARRAGAPGGSAAAGPPPSAPPQR